MLSWVCYWPKLYCILEFGFIYLRHFHYLYIGFLIHITSNITEKWWIKRSACSFFSDNSKIWFDKYFMTFQCVLFFQAFCLCLTLKLHTSSVCHCGSITWNSNKCCRNPPDHYKYSGIGKKRQDSCPGSDLLYLSKTKVCILFSDNSCLKW